MPEKKQRAPTLYAIIAIKLGKGSLLLLLALGVYSLVDNDLIHDYRQALHWVHIDPERKFFAELAKSIKNITPSNIYWVATGTAFPGRSRPLCPFPQHAHYKGRGNSEDAANFECR